MIFNHFLQTAGSHDARERPPGKRDGPLHSPFAQNQFIELNQLYVALMFQGHGCTLKKAPGHGFTEDSNFVPQLVELPDDVLPHPISDT